MRFLIEQFLLANLMIFILVPLVLIIKKCFGARISSKAYYFVWLLVMARIVFLINIPSPISISQLFSLEENIIHNIELTSNENIEKNNHSNLPNERQNNEIITEKQVSNVKPIQYSYYSNIKVLFAKKLFSLKQIIINFIFNNPSIIVIYIFIILIVLLIPVVSLIVLKKDYPYDNAETANSDEYKLLILAKEKIGVTKSINILFASDVDMPGIIGVIKPIIIIPESYREISEDKLLFILLHELTHYKLKHLHLLWITWVLKAIGWINPLIWLAYSNLKKEAELWCDEEVVKIIGSKETTKYGHLIIDMAAKKVEPVYRLNAVGFGNNKRELKERVNQLCKGIRPKHMVTISIVCLVALFAIFFTSGRINPYKPLEFTTKVEAEAINILDLMSIEIKDISYQKHSFTINYNVELDKKFKDIYNKQLYLVNGYTTPEESLEIRSTLKFPACENDSIRHSGLDGDIMYDNKRGCFYGIYSIYEYQLDSMNQKDYSFDSFGPCYLEINNVLYSLDLPEDEMIEFSKDNDCGSITYNEIGEIRYDDFFLEDKELSFSVESIGYNDFNISPSLTMIDRNNYNALSMDERESIDGGSIIQFYKYTSSQGYLEEDNKKTPIRFNISSLSVIPFSYNNTHNICRFIIDENNYIQDKG